MTSPLFSILIPTYNRPDYLSQAVASVMAQTITDFECVIVDDASPTPVAPPDDPRFRVIRHDTNQGYSMALNTALSAARGHYVTFLDDDDLYLPNRLELALEGLAKADIAICWRENFGEGMEPYMITDTWNGDLSRTIRERIGPLLCTVAVARDRALSFSTELRGVADGEWLLRMAQGNIFCTIPRVGLRYREHNSPRHMDTKAVRADMMMKVYDMHRAYFDANPKSASHHFRRIGVNAMSAGRLGMAFRSFAHSFALHPRPAILLTTLNAFIQYLRGRWKNR